MMTPIRDLNIEKEIFPLFDFSNNGLTQKVILDLLLQQLQTQEEINARQELLKAFIMNGKALHGYFYSRLEFLEVNQFLNEFCAIDVKGRQLKIQLLFSEKVRHQKRAKFSQLILFFERISTLYFENINFSVFPIGYRKKLEILTSFFSILDLKKFGPIIRKSGLQINHIVALTTIILKKLSVERVTDFWFHFFEFEAYLSLSLGITKHGLNFPVFSDTTFLLEDFYHPLLTNPVKNSFKPKSNVIVLTGPNMSGKSTLLKAVCLCVYLAHLGLAVPASKCELPFFNSITAAINLNDNLLSGYSHFMTEVINLKTIVMDSLNNKSCFAAFDELFRGTNMEDGMEITTTTVRGLLKFKHCIFLVSTHLHQLKEIEDIKANRISTYFIECELNNNIPIFTYKLKNGWSDLKVGRLLFEKEGLNKMLES